MLLAPATSPSSYIYIKQPLKHSNADFRRRLPWQWSSHQALKQHISKNHRKCHEVLTFDLCLFLKNRRWGDVLLFKHSQNWCDWNWGKKDKLKWRKQSWTDLKRSTCWQKMNKNNINKCGETKNILICSLIFSVQHETGSSVLWCNSFFSFLWLHRPPLTNTADQKYRDTLQCTHTLQAELALPPVNVHNCFNSNY